MSRALAVILLLAICTASTQAAKELGAGIAGYHGAQSGKREGGVPRLALLPLVPLVLVYLFRKRRNAAPAQRKVLAQLLVKGDAGKGLEAGEKLDLGQSPRRPSESMSTVSWDDVEAATSSPDTAATLEDDVASSQGSGEMQSAPSDIEVAAACTKVAPSLEPDMESVLNAQRQLIRKLAEAAAALEDNMVSSPGSAEAQSARGYAEPAAALAKALAESEYTGNRPRTQSSPVEVNLPPRKGSHHRWKHTNSLRWTPLQSLAGAAPIASKTRVKAVLEVMMAEQGQKDDVASSQGSGEMQSTPSDIEAAAAPAKDSAAEEKPGTAVAAARTAASSRPTFTRAVTAPSLAPEASKAVNARVLQTPQALAGSPIASFRGVLVGSVAPKQAPAAVTSTILRSQPAWRSPRGSQLGPGPFLARGTAPSGSITVPPQRQVAPRTGGTETAATMPAAYQGMRRAYTALP